MPPATSPLTLPRAVVLALWLDAVPDETPLALARAVHGDDEPHVVETADPDASRPSGVLAAADLTELAVAVRAGCLTAALLPEPGDPAGVPAVVSAAATEAGECLLLTADGRDLAAVPHVERFGSELEPGHLVTWRLTPVPTWRDRLLGTVGSLADAERDLRQGLLEATQALAQLDVARWREDAADEIAAVRDGAVPGHQLPGTLDPRRSRVLTSAARLRAIVRLATVDDGAAVNLWQADQRSTALREIDRAARRAMAAAAATPPA